jgi:hypothetical protein
MRTLLIALVAALALPGPAPAGELVGFRGSDRGWFRVTPIAGSPVVLAEDFTTGHATHLGRYTLVAREYVNLETLAVTEGSFTLTAANGDTLSGTYEGRAALSGVAGEITYHVEGPVTEGTGRFAGAEGRLVWDGIANLTTFQLSEVIRGEITSPGGRGDPR